LKYQTLIESVFKNIQREPRGNQTEIINQVLVEFFDNKKQNVVLNAPTGIGKSILGAVIAGCVDSLSEKPPGLSSIILMGTNGLAKQYAESFGHLDHHKFFQIKGASNYTCAFMEAQPSATSATGEECCKPMLHEMEVGKYCKGCEFDHAKKMVNKTDNLITNFSYFLTASLNSGHLETRKLHIFDEAHTFNDAYTSFTEILITTELLSKYIDELSNVNDRCNDEAAGLAMLKKKLENNEVHESSYEQIIQVLGQIYESASSTLTSQASLIKDHDKVLAMKYAKMAKKYENNFQRIKFLIDGEYEHVFDNTAPNCAAIKTIFVSDSIEACLGEKNLFMSATITENIAWNILGLDKDSSAFIMLDPVFPPENKPIFFVGKNALNYNTLKDPSVLTDLRTMVQKITERHSDDKGLLIAPSFYLGNAVAKNLKGVKVFEHVSGGKKLPELIREFKDYKGGALLVSPSIWEGFDIAESEYQILLKAPYASLGDKRIKYICDNYPIVYQEMTLLKILQGIGRSVRSPTDRADTYMLDTAIEKLFNGKSNLWKNHYKVLSKGK
jgi:Rad3-related DNA helicase